MGKSQTGLLIGSLALIVILITSPTTAIPNSGNFTTNSLDASMSMEFINVSPGLGTSTYSRIFVFGGHDGSNMPLDDSLSGFAETSSWVLLYADMDNFGSYLNRIPFEAATGLTLILNYPQGVSSTTLKAATAASMVEAEYGVTMYLSYFDGGFATDDYYVFYAMEDKFTEVATDVAAIDDDGFSTLIDVAQVTSAPVGWAAYGARDIADTRAAFHGVGWVDPNGIIQAGNEYTLSSTNILNSNIVPAAVPAYGLSRVSYYFPYPIAPVTNGITPETSNPLPQVTGEMIWDLRHPIPGYALPTATDFSVKYTLAVDRNFPNVQNKMSINQTLLNEGTFEVKFDLTNIGSETAYNIDLNFPLGPEFGALVDNNVTIYTIKDAYYLDESVEAIYTFSLTAPGVTVNYQLFNITGWYRNTADDSLAIWDTRTSYNLFTGTFLSQAVTIDIQSTNGFPADLITAFETHILPNLPDTLTSSISEVTTPIKENMGPALKQMFNDSFNSIYQEVDKFVFDKGDFSVQKLDVATTAASTESRYFLNHTVAELAPGANTTLSFRFNDIPTTSDTFALMHFNGYFTTASNGNDYPAAVLTSQVQDYYEFMQYMFQLHSFDGRPLSFNLPDSFELNFDGRLWSNTLASDGMLFTYEDGNEYSYFGMANGQNIQFADDEAVIVSSVTLDKQNYDVGDPVKITTLIENVGDLPATDITVHLYHATIGRDFRFERIDKIDELTTEDLAAGASVELTLDVEANTYLGYHTVFAVVEFTSDAGQDVTGQLTDFFDLGYDTFEAGGEVRHFTLSTLSGALVLPATNIAEPSIPEPLLTMTTEIISDTVTVASLSAGDEFTYKITIVNEGNDDTNAEFTQLYNSSQLEFVSATTTEGTVTDNAALTVDTGAVYVSGMNFAIGETITIEITFKMLGSAATLPPGVLAYSVDGDSSLGTTVDTGASLDLATTSNALFTSAGSEAQKSSEKSGSEDSSSSSYSASSSVGASVNTEGGEQSTVTGAPGFIGYGPEIIVLMAVPLTGAAIARKRK